MNWSFLLLMAYDKDGSSNGQFCLFGTSWGKGHRVICKVEALSTVAGGFKDILFSPRNLGKIPSLTNTFQGGWFNHQLVIDLKPCFMTLSIQICQICPKISGI